MLIIFYNIIIHNLVDYVHVLENSANTILYFQEMFMIFVKHKYKSCLN